MSAPKLLTPIGDTPLALSPVPIPLSEIAEQMGIGIETLKGQARRGAFPAYKLGAKWYVNPIDLANYKGAKGRYGDIKEGRPMDGQGVPGQQTPGDVLRGIGTGGGGQKGSLPGKSNPLD